MMQNKTTLPRKSFSPTMPLYQEAGVAGTLIKSLRFVMLGTIFGTVFNTLTTSGTALAGFTSVLGGSGLVFGILNAIPFLATLAQIPVSILLARKGKRKQHRILYGLISRFLWIIIGLIPFFVPMQLQWLRIYAVVFLLGASSLCAAFTEVTYGPWLADLLPEGIRGRWLSLRDIACNVIGILIGLFSALILNIFPNLTGYALVFFLAGVIGIADMLCYFFVEDPPAVSHSSLPMRSIIKQLWKDKPFLDFMLFWAFWLFTAYIASPYTNFYALENLGLSITAVTIYGQVIPSTITILTMPFWGKLIDRHGNKTVMIWACGLTSFTPLMLLFSTPNSAIVFFLYNLLGSAVWSVPFLVSFNMLLCNSPLKERLSYVAFFNCFTALCGSFLGVLFGGSIVEFLPRLFQSFSGIIPEHLIPNEYKILFFLSAMLRLVATFLFSRRQTNLPHTRQA